MSQWSGERNNGLHHEYNVRKVLQHAETMASFFCPFNIAPLIYGAYHRIWDPCIEIPDLRAPPKLPSYIVVLSNIHIYQICFREFLLDLLQTTNKSLLVLRYLIQVELLIALRRAVLMNLTNQLIV